MNFRVITILMVLLVLSISAFALSRAEIKEMNLNKNSVVKAVSAVQEVKAKSVELKQSKAIVAESNNIGSSGGTSYPGNGLPYVFSTLITYQNKVYRDIPFKIRSHLYSRENQSIALILGLYVCDLSSNPSCNHSGLIPAYYWNFYQNKWDLANSNYYWPALNNRFNMSKGEIKTVDTIVTYTGPMPPAGYKIYYCGAISNEWFFWPSNPVEEQHYRCRELPLRE
ncbi:MAG: hypothetical protein JW703_00615 [Candidatus Diapherotrites archaeon]|nr:hypothetical protein [Candidatus Diapherotrites archaeon]